MFLLRPFDENTVLDGLFFDRKRSGSHGEDLGPATLDGRNVFEFRDLNRDLSIERHMMAQEVVMGHDERGYGQRTMMDLKAAEWPDMIFECSVQAFDELFEWPELSGDLIEVLEPNDLFKRDFMGFVAIFVQEHDGFDVRGVSVGD